MWIYFCRWRIEVRRSTQGREMEEIFGSQSCLLSVLRKFNSSSPCYWTETVYRQMFGFERNCMEEEHIIRNFRERALKLHICENLFYHRLEGAEILSLSQNLCVCLRRYLFEVFTLAHILHTINFCFTNTNHAEVAALSLRPKCIKVLLLFRDFASPLFLCKIIKFNVFISRRQAL